MANTENLKRTTGIENLQQRYRGCLLAGAAGDALGSTVEFMGLEQIQEHFGLGGIRDFAKYYEYAGAVTDDTQMTLFTAEGLLRAYVREHTLVDGSSYTAIVDNAYQRWLRTQGYSAPLLDQFCGGITGVDDWRSGWLIQNTELFHRRTPGNTCIHALLDKKSLGDPAKNESKGCGGIMRVAPVGLVVAHGKHKDNSSRQAFSMGCVVAGLTHGHPTGQLAAGVFAFLIAEILNGMSLRESIDDALTILRSRPHHGETTLAIENAMALAQQSPATQSVLPQLGKGWVAEEALAIALYCNLSCDNLEDTIVLAVNHGGDSDSTGAIAGNLAGAIYGEKAIPGRWLEGLECRTQIGDIADDLLSFPRWELSSVSNSQEFERIVIRYPGY